MDGIICTLRANEFLNVRFKASESEIKSAYLRLMLMYHPDKNPKYVDRASWICKMIQEARSDAALRSTARKYPMLEHFKPVLNDDLSLCVCGFPGDGEVCDNCLRINMSKELSAANKSAVWNLCLRYVGQHVAGPSQSAIAEAMYKKHFGG